MRGNFGLGGKVGIIFEVWMGFSLFRVFVWLFFFCLILKFVFVYFDIEFYDLCLKLCLGVSYGFVVYEWVDFFEEKIE